MSFKFPRNEITFMSLSLVFINLEECNPITYCLIEFSPSSLSRFFNLTILSSLSAFKDISAVIPSSFSMESSKKLLYLCANPPPCVTDGKVHSLPTVVGHLPDQINLRVHQMQGGGVAVETEERAGWCLVRA